MRFKESIAGAFERNEKVGRQIRAVGFTSTCTQILIQVDE